MPTSPDSSERQFRLHDGLGGEIITGRKVGTDAHFNIDGFSCSLRIGELVIEIPVEPMIPGVYRTTDPNILLIRSRPGDPTDVHVWYILRFDQRSVSLYMDWAEVVRRGYVPISDTPIVKYTDPS